jgi:2,4-diaminopentanoate dehydrogenase
MLQVLVVGLGPLGQRVITDLVSRRLGAVAGAVDIDPALAGKALSSVVPSLAAMPSEPAANVKVHASLDLALRQVKFDVAIVTTSSSLRACADTFRTLLASGASIVSTCEELTFPWLADAKLATELDAMAKRAGGRLVGTGVNPGAMMDAIPVMLSCLCTSVSSCEIYRIQDATTRRDQFQKKIGATLSKEAFAEGIKAGWLRHVGLGESLHFAAHHLGLVFDRWEETIEPVIASRAMSCAIGAIAAGHACGVRQVATGYAKTGTGEKAVISLIFQAAIGQDNPMDRIVMHGTPNLDVTFAGGVHGDIATSAMTLNVMQSLLAAPSGLHTSASLPMLRIAHPSAMAQLADDGLGGDELDDED